MTKEIVYPEVESLVFALWNEDPEEIALEAATRFNLSFEFALEIVEEIIRDESEQDSYYEPSEYDEWQSYDPDC